MCIRDSFITVDEGQQRNEERRRMIVGKLRKYGIIFLVLLMAVSYTHLDVYKRQLMRISFGKRGDPESKDGMKINYAPAKLSLIHI